MTPPSPSAPPASRVEILVVDDEQSIREVIKLQLNDAGYDVDIADNGRTALDLLTRKAYDLILTDIRMPEVSGLDLLKHVRTNRMDTDVIMMTAYASMENAIETMREGAVDYIIKPFNMNDLAFIIERTLKKRNLQETESLFEFSKKIFSTIDFDQVLQIILDATSKVLRPDDVSLMMPGNDGELTIAIAFGLAPEIVRSTRVPMGRQIAGRVAQLKQPVVLNGPATREMGFEDLVPRTDVQSAIIYPLVWKDDLLGVLNLSRTRQPEPFTAKHLAKLSVYASLLCQALENARLHARANRLVQELTRTKEELTVARDHLEEKVRERTQQLSEAKNNLETYSRSLEQRTYEISTLYHLSLKIINVLEFKALVQTVDEVSQSLLRYDLLLCQLSDNDRRDIWLTGPAACDQAARAQLQTLALDTLAQNHDPAFGAVNTHVEWLAAPESEAALPPLPRQLPATPKIVSARLYMHGRQTGSLILFRFEGPAFDEAERNLFSMISTNVSLAIGNAYSFRKLQETDQIRSEFVSTVSHELKTPLTCIGQSIAMLCNGTVGTISEDQHECLDIAREEVARLERLIKNVLDISKMEAGKMELFPKRVSVPAIVQKALAVLAPRLREKQIQLAQECPEDLHAHADADAFLQILLNLMDNAIKFTPRGGRIGVRARADTDAVRVNVTDSGPGISEQNRKYLFEKFVQIVGNKHRPTGGSGLGLFICKHLVEMHHGEIRVESLPESGSTFSFTLPLAKDRAAPRSKASAVSHQGGVS